MDPHDVFEVLVRENGRMLSAYIHAAIVESSEADDIWQETMLTAWRRWDDYDRERPFGAWLRGIAKNKILASHRTRASAPILCDESALEYFGEVIAGIQSLQGDTFDEKLGAMRDCINALPDDYATAIRLRFQEDLKPARMAERLSIDLEAVKKRLYRAKLRLSRCLHGKLKVQADVALTRGRARV